MPISHCLDLTEFYLGKPSKLSHIDFISELLAEIERPVKRVYFGSNFCSHYLLSISDDQFDGAFEALKSLGIPVTLVVPIFTQSSLKDGKQRVRTLLQRYKEVVDELTVNDYGLLRCFCGSAVTINIGRLFNRDLRDIRYKAEYEIIHRPLILNDEICSLMGEYGVEGVELDLSHRSIDCSSAPETLTLAFYAPYSYISTAQICAYASIGLPADSKFRPNQACALQCQHTKRIVAGQRFTEFVTAGRTAYFLSDEAEVVNLDDYRLIHSPLIRKAL